MRLLPGVRSPLAGRKSEDIDFYIVRENNEGEYSQIGGRLYQGTEQETVIQESVFTRRGVDRILRFAFKLAQTREEKHLTSATKSNGIIVITSYSIHYTKLYDAIIATLDTKGPEAAFVKDRISYNFV